MRVKDITVLQILYILGRIDSTKHASYVLMLSIQTTCSNTRTYLNHVFK